MDICKTFGSNVRRLRRETGLSQEEFGLKFDIDRTYVSGVERGVRNPTLKIVAKFAAALGVEPPELLHPEK